MKGHRASDYQGSKRCHKCGRKHHQSLCDVQSVTRTENQDNRGGADYFQQCCQEQEQCSAHQEYILQMTS